MIKHDFICYFLKLYYKNQDRRNCFKEAERMINFLIAHNFLTNQVIRHFTVIAEFTAITEKKSFKNKTQVVKAISLKYDLHENTIWNIIKDHSHKFGEIP